MKKTLALDPRVQLQEARDALQVKKDAEAKKEAERQARETAAVGKVQAWLDQLRKASKVPLTIKTDTRVNWWTIYIGATTNIISVRARSTGLQYTYNDTHSGNGRDTSLEEIQQILCARVAEAEWAQSQEIAKKLTTTPAVT